MKLVSVGNYYGVTDPFSDLFESKLIIRSSTDLASLIFEKGDVVLFGGGEDISPSLYGQKPSQYTGASDQLSVRDTLEKKTFELALKSNIPMLGICRGAQLLCALSGGSLYQHVNNHAGKDHNMTTIDGEVINVCSVHHQMMNPFKTKHELLAWSSQVLSNVHLIEREQDLEVDLEPEVVFFPETNALAIQYHPEFMSINEEAVVYSRKLVQKYLQGV